MLQSDRSGETPMQVLGGTGGTLVVDMYTGYNQVTGTGGRERAGCLAHARRKSSEALNTAPEAQTALDLIREIYVIEHEIRAAGLSGTPLHNAARWRSACRSRRPLQRCRHVRRARRRSPRVSR